MYHKLTTIAQTHRFHQTQFLDFAEQNKEKYSVIHQYSPMTDVWLDLPREDWTIGTWWVNDLVNDFKHLNKA